MDHAVPLAPGMRLAQFLQAWDAYSDRKEFDVVSQQCGICFNLKKGRDSFRLTKCRHAFCRDCLAQFFAMLIREGTMVAVACPHEECRLARKGRDPFSPEIPPDPADILALVGEEAYARYAKLYKRKCLERDPLVAWCPHCSEGVRRESLSSRLCHCQSCGFAFCRICQHTWHGEQAHCQLDYYERVSKEYMAGSPEECRALEAKYGMVNIERFVARYRLEQQAQAKFEVWRESNAIACPGCQQAIQKDEGCNHMTCLACLTHFCYLCRHVISSSNPYFHYRDPNSPCLERLFEAATEFPGDPV